MLLKACDYLPEDSLVSSCDALLRTPLCELLKLGSVEFELKTFNKLAARSVYDRELNYASTGYGGLSRRDRSNEQMGSIRLPSGFRCRLSVPERIVSISGTSTELLRKVFR